MGISKTATLDDLVWALPATHTIVKEIIALRTELSEAQEWRNLFRSRLIEMQDELDKGEQPEMIDESPQE